MRSAWIVFVVAVGLLLALTQVQRQRAGRRGSSQALVELYPDAPAMPPPVSETVESLLARYETILRTRAPSLLASLQSGLSDARLDSLELQHGFKLPPDLRALYRWRNGTDTASSLTAFPEHRFTPLDEAIAVRDSVREEVARSTPAQREAYTTYAGHRAPWLGLIMDPAGDGYFFDPNREENAGSFFFSFAEDGTYIFFPAFRNFLAAVIDGNDTGVFRFRASGAETADFTRAQQLWLRYGAASTY